MRALRLAALGPSTATLSFELGDPLVPDRDATRRVWLGGAFREVPVRARNSIADRPEPGPLLVDEYDTTVVVPSGWVIRRHLGTGTLLLEQDAGRG